MTLPTTYSHFYSASGSTATDHQTLANLTSRLMMEEARLEGLSADAEESGTLFANKSGRSSHSNREAETSNKTVVPRIKRMVNVFIVRRLRPLEERMSIEGLQIKTYEEEEWRGLCHCVQRSEFCRLQKTRNGI